MRVFCATASRQRRGIVRFPAISGSTLDGGDGPSTSKSGGPAVDWRDMRTTWNGSLTFGLVSIPVGLAPATKPAARQSDVSFRLLHRECLTPIKQKRFCPLHDRELAPDEIVKGWEASKGQFVVVEEAELEALETHDDSRSIEISRFVQADDVDPIWRDRTYYLVPGTTQAQRRPHRLVVQAMCGTGSAPTREF